MRSKDNLVFYDIDFSLSNTYSLMYFISCFIKFLENYMEVFSLSSGNVLTCKPPDMHSYSEYSTVFWYKQMDFSADHTIVELYKTFLIFSMSGTYKITFTN